MIVKKKALDIELQNLELPVPEPLILAGVESIKPIYLNLIINSELYEDCFYLHTDALLVEKDRKEFIVLDEQDVPENIFRILIEADTSSIKVLSLSEFVECIRKGRVVSKNIKPLLVELFEKARNSKEVIYMSLEAQA